MAPGRFGTHTRRAAREGRPRKSKEGTISPFRSASATSRSRASVFWWPWPLWSASGCSTANGVGRGGRIRPSTPRWPESSAAWPAPRSCGQVSMPRANRPRLDLLYPAGGLTWFGRLAGGLTAGLGLRYRRPIPIVSVNAAAIPALGVAQASGRVGCLSAMIIGATFHGHSRSPRGCCRRPPVRPMQ